MGGCGFCDDEKLQQTHDISCSSKLGFRLGWGAGCGGGLGSFGDFGSRSMCLEAFDAKGAGNVRCESKGSELLLEVLLED